MEGRHTVVLLMSLGLLTESRRNLLSKLTLRRQTWRPKGPFPRNMCVPRSVAHFPKKHVCPQVGCPRNMCVPRSVEGELGGWPA